MASWQQALLATASVLSSLPTLGFAFPAPDKHNEAFFNSSHPFAEFGLGGHDKRADQTIELRILGLGASIMSGRGSSTYNGLRKPLRDALRADGWQVDMVGSLHGGSMQDNEHEAVPGDVLTQILARVPNSTPYKPNIVIINGGTNDASGSIDIPNTGTRMNNILNALWGAEDMANTCIMLSTIIPTTNTAGAANRGSINDQYRSLVASRAAEGKCIYLADMDPGGVQWLQFDTDYYPSEDPHVHPNDAGHKKMAAVFYKAINAAITDNRIVAPASFTRGPTVCNKYEGTGKDAGGLTQRGSGSDDGIYYHNSEEKGTLWSATSNWDRAQWKFGRLFDRNYDDFLAWINDTSSTQHYAVWANSADGKGSFTQISDLSPDLDCGQPAGVHFIDMNADGLDDLVYIDTDGNAYLSINQGDGNRATGKPPTFKRVSDTALIKTNEGYGRAQVVLADIDGDGRGDYGVVQVNGDIYFWRNGWVNDIPAYWEALGLRFTGKNLGDITGTRFEDVNGDGRDDWLWMDQTGAGYIYTNSRSCAIGSEGNGLNVAWRQGFSTGQSSGPAYKGMGVSASAQIRDRVFFARIYGQSTIFGNLPTQDYVYLEHNATASGTHQFAMRVWKNTGGGATKLLADGNKYCNMMGHKNGMVDYVWAYSFGTMELWANRGKGSIYDGDVDGFWDYKGTIWTPPSNINRRDLHLADWDGDGDCDIVYVNPQGGGVQVWLNNYPTSGNWNSWTYLSNPAPSLTCSQTRGLGIYDLAVRMADITGNGRTDYLCIEKDSRITGFTQGSDGSWTNAGQIKVSIGYDRANLQFADVNGDKTADLLWTEKFTGDTYVWYNQGSADPSQAPGSSFSWGQQTEKAFTGQVAGTCESFADLDGSGRADEHYVLGTFDNTARTSLSPLCSGLQDRTGDDDTSDGVLPTVPGG